MSEKRFEPDLVIDDDLLIQYLDFIAGKKEKDATIGALLYHYRHDHLTNYAQLERIGRVISPQLKVQLLHRPEKKDGLVELAARTKFKVILSQREQSDYPYLNIYSDVFDNAFTAVFKRHEPRNKAYEHLKSLCAKAKIIYVYDAHFSKQGVENVQILERILPKKKIKIIYSEDHIKEPELTQLRTICSDWDFEARDLWTHHDRYIIIDDKIEVILTSGFYHFSVTTKDCSYIVREIDHNDLVIPL